MSIKKFSQTNKLQMAKKNKKQSDLTYCRSFFMKKNCFVKLEKYFYIYNLTRIKRDGYNKIVFLSKFFKIEFYFFTKRKEKNKKFTKYSVFNLTYPQHIRIIQLAFKNGGKYESNKKKREYC